VQLDKTQHQRSVQLHRWRTQHRDELFSTQQQASKQQTTEHNASAKLEETLGKLQQMLANNAEAEVSRKSAEKERRTVEQTELQATQEAQEAILHDIQTALDSIPKRVTAIEETQQRDWQTQVQQHDKITKIQHRCCSNSRQCTGTRRTHSTCRQVSRNNTVGTSKKQNSGMQKYCSDFTRSKRNRKTKQQENTGTTQHDEHEVQHHSLPNATATVDTDTGTVSAAAQHKRDEMDVPEKVAGGKVNAETQNDYVREHRLATERLEQIQRQKQQERTAT